MSTRPARRSTAAGWAFIETSSTPLHAPSNASTAASTGRLGLNTGCGIVRQKARAAAEAITRLPQRAISQPAVGRATPAAPDRFAAAGRIAGRAPRVHEA
jgi:hypothetical protein